MENSILISTKKILGVAASYTAFDLDIITHINTALSTLNQLGVGPAICVAIEDDSAVWDALALPQNQLSMARTYLFVKVRALFDPHITSFHIDASDRQIQELEWRLSAFRDELIPLLAPPPNPITSPEVFWYGGSW